MNSSGGSKKKTPMRRQKQWQRPRVEKLGLMYTQTGTPKDRETGGGHGPPS